MSGENKQTVIIDQGSSSTKAGLTGTNQPYINFPSLVGRPNIPGIISGIGLRKVFIGQSVMEKRGLLGINRPLENGSANNWEDIEHIWKHIYNDLLKVVSQDYPCLITENIQNTRLNRIKTAQVIFELFNVPSLSIFSQPVLSLYATGLVSGIVLQSGASNTSIVPIFEGYKVLNGTFALPFAGNYLNQYLESILPVDIKKNTEQHIVQNMKEKVCYVQNDQNIQNSSNEYTFPDGQKISLKEECFKCPELLFNPNIKNCDGITELIKNTLDSQNFDKQLMENLILAGGSTLFPGIKERLQSEFKQISKKIQNTTIIEFQDRIFQPLIGAHHLSQLSTFQKMFITKEQFFEHGENIICSRFF